MALYRFEFGLGVAAKLDNWTETRCSKRPFPFVTIAPDDRWVRQFLQIHAIAFNVCLFVHRAHRVDFAFARTAWRIGDGFRVHGIVDADELLLGPKPRS